MHHPPDANPGKRAPRGARAGLGALAEQGADVILCGHLHVWRVGPVATEEGVLLVQAGTGLSTRVRGEPNDFNILTVEDAALLVERHGATSDGARFVTLSKTPFRKVAGRWHRMD